MNIFFSVVASHGTLPHSSGSKMVALYPRPFPLPVFFCNYSLLLSLLTRFRFTSAFVAPLNVFNMFLACPPGRLHPPREVVAYASLLNELVIQVFFSSSGFSLFEILNTRGQRVHTSPAPTS